MGLGILNIGASDNDPAADTIRGGGRKLNVSSAVISRATTAPPGSPALGNLYIVPTGATGAWSGQTNKVAYYNGTTWEFYTPAEGWRTWVSDEDVMVVYTGAAWDDTAIGGGGGGTVVAVDEEGVEVVASAARLNFTGAGVTVTDLGAGEVGIDIPASGGGGGGGSMTGAEIVAAIDAELGSTDWQGGGGAATPTTFRYWRLRIDTPGTQTASLSTLAEIQFRETVGGADATTGGTASASQNDFSSVAASAFDNNAATWWGSDTTPSGDAVWIKYDFGAGNEKWIEEYTVQARSGGERIQTPRAFALQYSEDDVSWTTADTRSALTWSAGETKTFTTSASQPSGGGGSMSGAAIVAAIDAELGSTDWQGGSSGVTYKTISGAYTLLNSDLAGDVYMTADTSAGACTITVPDTLTNLQPVLVERNGANDVTFVAGSGATIQSADGHLRLRVNFSTASLVPKGTDVYTLSGDIAA